MTNNIESLATIAALDLTNVTGGAGASLATPKISAQRQRAWANKLMSQPFPSESIPGLNLL